ncbi:MAG: DinB family protein [Chloroflexi bacterium]|nr:DinB family protein [Chloroflexota bacterium]
MSDTDVQEYLARLLAVQQRALAELTDMPREELRFAADVQRWTSVRRLLLRLGDHLREHTTQLVEAREAIGAAPTMPQRILAQAMVAQGYVLGAMVGLQDEDLDTAPAPGEWTPRQVLEHIISTQAGYLEAIQRARQTGRLVERD